MIELRIRKKLKEISEVLQKHWQDTNDIGVLSGTSGIALFQFYYSRLLKEESHAELAAEIISHSIEKINQGYSQSTFCAGIAGAVWAVEFLKAEDFIELDTDALLAGLDDFLESSLEIDTQENFYDFLHGVIGLGHCFLKRYQHTTSQVLKQKYKGILLGIVERLKKTAQIEGDTAKWESNLVRNQELRGYNLGLSHGISSIINFLARLALHNDFSGHTTKILQQAVNFIEKCAYKTSKTTSIYPDWITVSHQLSDSGRLAWCYGDLGIGISLWHASQALQDQNLENRALTILKHTAKRKDIEEARIMDAGLCHGSFGVMHIYYKIYQKSKAPILKDAADFWMEQALNMDTHKEGHAGYCQWHGGDQPGWRKEVNLLEGIAGIGLAMISYIAPFETSWDECMMIG